MIALSMLSTSCPMSELVRPPNASGRHAPSARTGATWEMLDLEFEHLGGLLISNSTSQLSPVVCGASQDLKSVSHLRCSKMSEA